MILYTIQKAHTCTIFNLLLILLLVPFFFFLFCFLFCFVFFVCLLLLFFGGCVFLGDGRRSKWVSFKPSQVFICRQFDLYVILDY